MIIVRLLSPGPWLVGTTKVYSGVGADIVMESISPTIMPGMLPDRRARHFFYFFLNAPDAHFARCPASVVGLLANRSESSSFAANYR